MANVPKSDGRGITLMQRWYLMTPDFTGISSNKNTRLKKITSIIILNTNMLWYRHVGTVLARTSYNWT